MCTMNFELRILILLEEYLVFYRILIFNADYELPFEDFGTSFVRISTLLSIFARGYSMNVVTFHL